MIHFASLNLIIYTKAGIGSMFICCWKLGKLETGRLLRPTGSVWPESTGPAEGRGRTGRPALGSSGPSGLLTRSHKPRAASASENHMEGFGKGDHMFSPQNWEWKGNTPTAEDAQQMRCSTTSCYCKTQVNFSWITDFSKTYSIYSQLLSCGCSGKTLLRWLQITQSICFKGHRDNKPIYNSFWTLLGTRLSLQGWWAPNSRR